MTEAEKLQKFRRELHAALAMHAIVLASSDNGSGDDIAGRAYEIADAMIEKGGPLE